MLKICLDLRTLSTMAALYLMLTSLLFCSVAATHEGPSFQVLQGAWSSCSRINASNNSCYRTREAVCVRTSDNRTASWYFCTERGAERPQTVEICPQGSCLQNCAVSEWSAWSTCNCSLDLFKNRTRRVLSPPRNGGRTCPSLFERSLCPCARNLPFDAQPRRHTWRTLPWRGCRAFNASSRCGAGLRSRSVECVNVEGQVVDPAYCLQEPAYSHLQPPQVEMLCEIPCSCILGEWSPFSSCAPVCTSRSPRRGHRTRTRLILRSPTPGGQGCEATEEIAPCSFSEDTCPNYIWETSDWSPCRFQRGASCGRGHMKRYVYCLEIQNGTSRSVDNIFCQRLANQTQPLTLHICEVSCPRSCHVGEWSEWTECPITCQRTYSNRTRSVLVPPSGNEVCPHTLELRPCPEIPCARWMAKLFVCLSTNGSVDCGPGTESRQILCVDPEGRMLDPLLCRGLPSPSPSMSCHIPCPHDCVLSDWSDWSPCSRSEVCSGHIVYQTRQRHFVAQGLNCSHTAADLIETRACPNDTTICNPATHYYIQQQPWGRCIAVEDPLRSSGGLPDLIQFDDFGFSSRCNGRGTRNHTNVCMKGNQVVQPSDCPITFQLTETESCELPCPRECEYTEWSAYSECPCGVENPMHNRTRRLIQFSSPDDDRDCNVGENGLQSQSEVCVPSSCQMNGGVVAWRTSEWSTCHLFEEISSRNNTGSQSRCGLGYQNRTVVCVEIGTNSVVSSVRCDTALSEARPMDVHSCHRSCVERCLVTEWSDFSTCTFGGSMVRHRDIIPRTGYIDWHEGCPELSSIVTVENISCPSFLSSCYAYHQEPWTDCILDSPLDTCGNGRQYRNVLCVNACSLFTPVDESFCELAGSPRPPQEDNCNIKCERNCIQSNWTDWSPCSTTCGTGYRSRTRSTITPNITRGRPCGPQMETDTCDNEPCPLVEVLPGSFGECIAENTTSQCGPGVRSREPLCFINRELHEYSACGAIGSSISFPRNETCLSPCPGECVMGEWGEWSSCSTNCPVGSCQRHRQRSVLRKGSDGCMEMMQQYEICYPPENPHQWRVGPWKDCIIKPPDRGGAEIPSPGHYCGEGVHSRVVNCVNSMTGEVVVDLFCSEADLDKPVTSENCSLPCPVDCRVGPFSDWSECERCASRSVQWRERSVVIAPMYGGEECPDLRQGKPCGLRGCVAHTLRQHGIVSDTDYTTNGQCGSISMRQALTCLRNTAFVSSSQCPNWEAAESPSYNTSSCPLEPNCTFSEWSDWSECKALCQDPQVSFSFRTRRLMSSHSGSTSACESQQHQQRPCSVEPESEMPSLESENWNGTEVTTEISLQPTEMTGTCLDFTWQVSEWNANGRDVYCESNTGIRVENGGCPNLIMPRSRNETCDDYDCPIDATCHVIEGKCNMSCPGYFEEIQGACLPKRGCSRDSHCLLPHTNCSSHANCTCGEGYTMTTMDDGNRCEPVVTFTPPHSIATSTKSTSSTSASTSNATSTMAMTRTTMATSDHVTSMATDAPRTTTTPHFTTEVNTTTSTKDGLGTLPIVLISALLPLVIIIVLVIIIILITCRCSKNLERKHKSEQELNRRRMKDSISSPSPIPKTAEEMMQRGTFNNTNLTHGISLDLQKYGLPGTTFLGSANGDSIDEPFISHSTPQQNPIPIAGPVPPFRNQSLQHDGPIPYEGTPVPHPRNPHNLHNPHNPHSLHNPHNLHNPHPPHHIQQTQTTSFLTDFPDGGVTTDMTYTTDEETIGTTSVPPSSTGSPNTSRRQLPPHMYPTSIQQEHGYPNPTMLQNQSSENNNYVSMHRMAPAAYARVKNIQERQQQRYREESSSPPHSPGHYSRQGGSYRSIQPGERDGRIAVGLDNSLIQAVSQLDRDQAPHTPTSYHSTRSGSRRRHGRRRHHRSSMRSQRYNYDPQWYHGDSGHYYHDGRYHGNGYYHSDGHYSTSDHDRYSTSDAEYPSLPRSPEDYHSKTLPHPPPAHFSFDSHHPHGSHHPHHYYEHQSRDYYPGDGEHRHHNHNSLPRDDDHHPDKPYHYDYYEKHLSRQQSQYHHRHGSPNRSPNHSPNRHGSLNRHGSPNRYGSPTHHRHSSPSSSRRHHQHHQQHSPPVSPRDPPNFNPPAPPHLQPPSGKYSNYDYPSRFQPQALQKLKAEAEIELNNPYARPRPLNGLNSAEPVGRVTSPYDYPKIRSAGNGASQTPPTTPSTNLSSPQTAFSSPNITPYNSSTPQSSPKVTPHNAAVAQSSPQVNHHHNATLTPQPSPQVTPHNPQSSATLPVQSSMPTSQSAMSEPSASTPQLSTAAPPLNSSTPHPDSTPKATPKLVIQVTPHVEREGVSPLSSPLLSSRQHPPSPLVLHSSSVSDSSPRTSGEVQELETRPEVTHQQLLPVQQ